MGTVNPPSWWKPGLRYAPGSDYPAGTPGKAEPEPVVQEPTPEPEPTGVTFESAREEAARIQSSQGSAAAEAYRSQYPEFFGPGSGTAEAGRQRMGVKMYYEQVVAEPRVVTRAGSDEYVFEGEISPEQISELKKWASNKGARIELGDPMSTMAGVVYPYKIVSASDLRQEQVTKRRLEEAIMGKPSEGLPRIISEAGYTPTDVLVTTVPSVQTIKERERKATLERATERAISAPEGPIDATIKGAQLSVAAAFGPFSEKYLGSYVPYVVPPTSPAYPVVAPYIKEFKARPSDVMKETISYEFGVAEREFGVITTLPTPKTMTSTRKSLGISEDILPLKEVSVPAVTQRKFLETATSPPITIASSVVGGYALGASAKAVAFAGTTTGKILLPATAITLTAPAVMDIAAEPSIEAKAGKAITLGGALVGGGIGYKLGTMKPVKVDVSLADVKGISTSSRVPKTQEVISEADFQVRTTKLGSGKEYVIRGRASYTTRATGRGRAIQDVTIEIPGQKAPELKYPKIGDDLKFAVAQRGRGKVTVKPQTYDRFATVKEVSPKDYAAKASGDVFDTPFMRKLIGAERSVSRVKQYRESRLPKYTKRMYRGVGYSETARELEVKIAFDSRTKQLMTDVTRTGIKRGQASRVDWLDIELNKITSKVEPATRARPTGRAKPEAALKQVTEPKIKAEPPTSAIKDIKITLKGPREDLLGLKTPKLAYTTASAGLSLQETRIGMASASATRQRKATRQKVREIPAMASLSSSALDRLPKMEDLTRSVMVQLPGEDVIIDQKQDQSTGQILRQIQRTTTETVTTETITATPPPIDIEEPRGGGIIGFPLGFRVGWGRTKPTKFTLKEIKNPVPKTLKIKEPKLSIKI